MTIKTTTGYALVCDQEGCGADTQSIGEFSFWGDRESAVLEWTESEGIVLDDDTAFCRDHRDSHECSPCGKQSKEALPFHAGERMCPECVTNWDGPCERSEPQQTSWLGDAPWCMVHGAPYPGGTRLCAAVAGEDWR